MTARPAENKLAAPYHVSPAMTGFEELDLYGSGTPSPIVARSGTRARCPRSGPLTATANGSGPSLGDGLGRGRARGVRAVPLRALKSGRRIADADPVTGQAAWFDLTYASGAARPGRPTRRSRTCRPSPRHSR